MSLNLGVWIPSRGPLAMTPGIAEMARVAEAAGFDLLVVGDHVVMPAETASKYPFSADGKTTWNAMDPYHDAIVALTICAAVTTRPEIATGVMVLPQRHPVILAKQLASLDVASGGRLVLGVGVGWLEEEFTALEVPFSSRGKRMDEWVHLLRTLWTGEPDAFEGAHYRLPAGVLCFPRPLRRIPIIVGGMSSAALRRSADLDGWFALFPAGEMSTATLEPMVTSINASRDARGQPRVVLRLQGNVSDAFGELPRLEAIGVTDLVIEADLTSLADATEQVRLVREHLSIDHGNSGGVAGNSPT